MALSGTFFDADYYFSQYSDVAANWSGTGLEHYTAYGASEGRAPNSWFDYQYYRANNSDLQGMTALQLFEHYENYGYAEGRIPSSAYAEFDAAQYLADYSDLSAGGITTATALWHYLVYGQNEGRTMPGGSTTSQTYTLTANQDIFTGGSGTDIIRGVAGQAVGNQDQTTLNSSDILDGGAGEDKLVVNMTGANYIGGATIKNIETLQIGSNIAAATFDYNVNAGAYEITGTNKVIFDQITTGETLNVTNIVNTAEGDVIPTLSWENEAGAGAGFANVTFRQAAISGSTTNLDVVLSNVAGGNLGIARGVETITINSAGSSTNTLNNDLVTNRDGGVAGVDLVSEAAGGNAISDDSTLTKVVVTGDQAFGSTAGVVATTGNANLGLTNRAAGADGGIVAETPNTASNLVSVAATVTEIDASDSTGGVAMRFTPRVNNADVNVTFTGGSGNDYIEFERGAVNATGGAGADTFAFITAQAGITNSGFGSTDSIVGGEGTDTIQIGLNGVGTYTLNTSEFSNKTGIDVLDIRGATNDVRVSSQFVSAADSGTKLTIRTDKMVQTTLENSANPTGANAAENNSTSVINLTDLTLDQGVKVLGGSGSERVVTNNASLNANTELDLGTNGGVAGRYDTVTVLDSAVIDSGDLANVKGVEALILAETVNGVSTYRIDLTETFLLNNTAATNDVTTTIDETTFRIGSAASSTGTALVAGDIVTIDISGLLNSTRTALATSLNGRGIDVALGAATVNYVVDGAAATAAQIALVTKADASRADAGVTSAAGAVATPAVTVAVTAGGTFTGTAGTNDNFNATLAALSPTAPAITTITGTATDTETLTLTTAGTDDLDSGGVAGSNVITNIDNVVLADGTNVITFLDTGGLIQNGIGVTNITGGTGNDTVILDNLVVAFDAAGVVGTLDGGAGLNTIETTGGAAQALDLTNDTVTNFQILQFGLGGDTVTIGANSFPFTQVRGTAASADTLIFAANTNLTTTTFDANFGAGGNGVINVNTGVTVTISGDTQLPAATTNFTGAGTLVTNGNLTLAAADTVSNVTFGQGGVTITTAGAAVQAFTGSAGADILETADATTLQTFNITQGGSDTIRADATGAAAAGSAGLVTVTGFQGGALASGGDVISLSYTAATAGYVETTAATGFNITANGDIGGGVGAITNVVGLGAAAHQVTAGQLGNTAAVQTAIVNAALVAITTEFYYVAVDDGASTGIYRFGFTDGNGDGIINVASEVVGLTEVVRLTGVADVTTLDAVNFA